MKWQPSIDDLLRYFVSGVFAFFCFWLYCSSQAMEIIKSLGEFKLLLLILSFGLVFFQIYRITFAELIFWYKDEFFKADSPRKRFEEEYINIKNDKNILIKDYEIIWHTIREFDKSGASSHYRRMSSNCHLFYQFTYISFIMLAMSLIRTVPFLNDSTFWMTLIKIIIVVLFPFIIHIIIYSSYRVFLSYKKNNSKTFLKYRWYHFYFSLPLLPLIPILTKYWDFFNCDFNPLLLTIYSLFTIFFFLIGILVDIKTEKYEIRCYEYLMSSSRIEKILKESYGFEKRLGLSKTELRDLITTGFHNNDIG